MAGVRGKRQTTACLSAPASLSPPHTRTIFPQFPPPVSGEGKLAHAYLKLFKDNVALPLPKQAVTTFLTWRETRVVIRGSELPTFLFGCRRLASVCARAAVCDPWGVETPPSTPIQTDLTPHCCTLLIISPYADIIFCILGLLWPV